MKAKFKNEVHLEGLLYEHSLTLKTSGAKSQNPGTEFISGTLKVATDPEILNIVEVHFTYVTATTKNGTTNNTFVALRNIIEGKVMTYVGNNAKEDYVPTYLRIDTTIGLNDFYTERDGKEELVSARRNEGGFVHIIKENEMNPEVEKRNSFNADMVITSIRRVEADEEKETEERMFVKGVIFDFRRGILPMEFVMYDPQGMELFESQEPSASVPFCTNIRGSQVSQTVMIKRTEPSAFGPALVREYPRSRKEFVIESIFGQISYPWDDESFITADELRKAIADRETYLATVKQRNDEYKASREAAKSTTQPAAAPTIKSKSGDFNF